MKVYATKTSEGNSRTGANDVARHRGRSGISVAAPYTAISDFVDMRPEAVAQRKLQRKANGDSGSDRTAGLQRWGGQNSVIQGVFKFQGGTDFRALIGEFLASSGKTVAAGILEEIEKDQFTTLQWIPISKNDEHKGLTTLYISDGIEYKNMFLYDDKSIRKLPKNALVRIDLEVTFEGETNKGELKRGRTGEWYVIIHEVAAHLMQLWPLVRKLREGKAELREEDKIVGGAYHPSTHHAAIPEHKNAALEELIKVTSGYITTAILIHKKEWSIQPFIDALEDDEFKSAFFDDKKDLQQRILHASQLIEKLSTTPLEGQVMLAKAILKTLYEHMMSAWNLLGKLKQLREDTKSKGNIDLLMEGGIVSVPSLPKRPWGPETVKNVDDEIKLVQDRYVQLRDRYLKVQAIAQSV